MKNIVPWCEIIIAVAVPVIFIAFGVLMSMAILT